VDTQLSNGYLIPPSNISLHLLSSFFLRKTDKIEESVNLLEAKMAGREEKNKRKPTREEDLEDEVTNLKR